MLETLISSQNGPRATKIRRAERVVEPESAEPDATYVKVQAEIEKKIDAGEPLTAIEKMIAEALGLTGDFLEKSWERHVTEPLDIGAEGLTGIRDAYHEVGDAAMQEVVFPTIESFPPGWPADVPRAIAKGAPKIAKAISEIDPQQIFDMMKEADVSDGLKLLGITIPAKLEEMWQVLRQIKNAEAAGQDIPADVKKLTKLLSKAENVPGDPLKTSATAVPRDLSGMPSSRTGQQVDQEIAKIAGEVDAATSAEQVFKGFKDEWWNLEYKKASRTIDDIFAGFLDDMSPTDVDPGGSGIARMRRVIRDMSDDGLRDLIATSIQKSVDDFTSGKIDADEYRLLLNDISDWEDFARTQVGKNIPRVITDQLESLMDDAFEAGPDPNIIIVPDEPLSDLTRAADDMVDEIRFHDGTSVEVRSLLESGNIEQMENTIQKIRGDMAVTPGFSSEATRLSRRVIEELEKKIAELKGGGTGIARATEATDEIIDDLVDSSEAADLLDIAKRGSEGLEGRTTTELGNLIDRIDAMHRGQISREDADKAIKNIKKAIKKAEDAQRAPFEAARAEQAAETSAEQVAALHSDEVFDSFKDLAKVDETQASAALDAMRNGPEDAQQLYQMIESGMPLGETDMKLLKEWANWGKAKVMGRELPPMPKGPQEAGEEWVKRGNRILDEMAPEERWSSTDGPIPPTAPNANMPDAGDLVEDGLINEDTLRSLGLKEDWKVLSKKQVLKILKEQFGVIGDAADIMKEVGHVGDTGELQKLFMGRQDVPILNLLLWLGY